MPDMQQVEAAVGRHHAAAFRAQLLSEFRRLGQGGRLDPTCHQGDALSPPRQVGNGGGMIGHARRVLRRPRHRRRSGRPARRRDHLGRRSPHGDWPTACPPSGASFLVAGKGGLNLTHSEPLEKFVTRYGDEARWQKLLDGFFPDDLRAWTEGLGIETFIGTSGRVFPDEQAGRAAPASLDRAPQEAGRRVPAPA